MTRSKKSSESSGLNTPKTMPATTPEGRENQLCSLAVDLAEKQLREGTASPSVVVHYLKLASTRERIEKEMLEKKVELMTAQKESLDAAQRIEEVYTKALDAMRLYSGNSQKSEEDDDYED
ncbi:MAG: hypothetical protein LIP10_03525 [Clostridiales bacterium]|nr:hypothetical protein [Clostridiales bacterium]